LPGPPALSYLACSPWLAVLTCQTRVSCQRHCQLRANDRSNAYRTCGFVKARHAVDAVAIEQRNRVVTEFGRTIDDRLRQRCALQEAEG
jgi:hypothetical protein